MKVLITGSSGKLARELVKVYPRSVGVTHSDLNIDDRKMVMDCLRSYKPDLIIHTAALTGIRQCEENKALAYLTNVIGTRNLVDACKEYCKDTFFAYVSTACVFYGDEGDYTEEDVPHPKNYYALTKLLGEMAVSESPLKNMIIRTNFAAREKWPYQKSFVDRYGTYLFADDLALAIRETLSNGLEGIVHICGDEKISMYELAKITTPEVQPMTLDEYKGPPLTVDMTLGSVRIKPFKLRRSLTQVL